MKGLSFQNGVEYKITIEGESWSPGDKITGQIETKPGSDAQIILADGLDKKVKLKSADAFVVLDEVELKKAPYGWSFELPLNTRISDKSGSLYLLYGKGDAIEKYGQLRLNVVPHLLLRDLSDLLTAEFRFAIPTFSHGKSKTTELKLDPPGLKEWTMLEQLILQLTLSVDALDVKFQFHRKEIDPTRGGLSTILVKREIVRKWKRKEIIYDFNQRLNKEVVAAEFEKVVAEYRDAGWLSTSSSQS